MPIEWQPEARNKPHETLLESLIEKVERLERDVELLKLEVARLSREKANRKVVSI